ncbi:MAG: nucleotide exchange factor GrpE [Rikenellaceae bacterium]|jgi:molecular chaperone GrpE|nr:nucleotide exchange factor GrpE [Rikenellaceae bacterium]
MKQERDTMENTGAEEFTGTQPNFEADTQFEGDGGAADKVSDKELADAVNPAQVADEPDWKDKYARLSAEFDNYRKRTLKEKMELITTGGEEVIKAILPVLDDMDRAVEAIDRSDDIDSARKGMHLIYQKLIDTLKQRGVSEIVSTGEAFDTDLHEAITRFPSEDQKGKVIDTVQKGYKLKDKVIRFSKVVVGE